MNIDPHADINETPGQCLKRIGTYALCAALLVGSGYSLKKIYESSQKKDGIFARKPSAEVIGVVADPNSPGQTIRIVKYYISDSTTLWAGVSGSKGTNKLADLSEGLAVGAELPPIPSGTIPTVQQKFIPKSQTWVHVRLPDGRKGLVAREDLSPQPPLSLKKLLFPNP